MTPTRGGLVFCWENFGPTHVDRCEAVGSRLTAAEVTGLELRTSSAVYDWVPETGNQFLKVTRSPSNRRFDILFPFWVVKEVIRARAKHVFLCHYNEIGIQVAAVALWALGLRVYMLIDSKFDDVPRVLWREALKSIWIKPYRGGVAGSKRSREYLRFLGFEPKAIAGGYDTIALGRIRSLADEPPAPAGVSFEKRHLTIIARLVTKKNLFNAIEGFAIYTKSVSRPKHLRIFGNGPLEQALRTHSAALGVTDYIVFEGFRQTADICRALASSVALILVSTEEQFGLSIIEALAMGVPVIVSDRCGARDDFVRAGVNGFVVEPDNVQGIAFFIQRIAEDENLWTELARGAAVVAERADASCFAESVAQLVHLA